jgi:copper chaperone NosL
MEIQAMTSTQLTRRRLLCGCAALAAAGLAGCGRKEQAVGAGQPHEITAQASCSLDGMLLADYPGPKGQVIYKGDSQVNWFCDSMELLSTLLKPEQAVYVLGGKRHGSMGPTAASFADEAAAKAFAAQWGGRVLRYAEIAPDMVDLSGGALHDTRM